MCPAAAQGHAAAVLRGFADVLQMGGYAACTTLVRKTRPEGHLVLAHRWAHGRRQLRVVFDRAVSAVAKEGLRRIAQLHASETELKGFPPEARCAARQVRAKPLVEAFGARLSSKSRAGERLADVASLWDGLCVPLGDGRVEIASNAVESTIHPIALGRTNALFAGHEEGGRARGRSASPIDAARTNGVESFTYLNATLEALANGHPQSRLDDLLPRAFWPTSSRPCWGAQTPITDPR